MHLYSILLWLEIAMIAALIAFSKLSLNSSLPEWGGSTLAVEEVVIWDAPYSGKLYM